MRLKVPFIFVGLIACVWMPTFHIHDVTGHRCAPLPGAPLGTMCSCGPIHTIHHEEEQGRDQLILHSLGGVDAQASEQGAGHSENSCPDECCCKVCQSLSLLAESVSFLIVLADSQRCEELSEQLLDADFCTSLFRPPRS